MIECLFFHKQWIHCLLSHGCAKIVHYRQLSGKIKCLCCTLFAIQNISHSTRLCPIILFGAGLYISLFFTNFAPNYVIGKNLI